ncbi:MAG TPA: hypothetical protein VLJ39_18380 [Tepidisphaeraceae bacterium]|nr:hypothetical protein [Tepidisphaeraceae bacterium]
MTTEYPGNTPTGPGNVPPPRDAGWGCAWWWWIVIIFIILIFWWAGWGWGPSGGYWFRSRPAGGTSPNTVNPNVPVAPAAPATSRGAMLTPEMIPPHHRWAA